MAKGVNDHVMVSLSVPAIVTIGGMNGFIVPLIAAKFYCLCFGIPNGGALGLRHDMFRTFTNPDNAGMAMMRSSFQGYLQKNGASKNEL